MLRIVVIGGPTASGKSALAVELARQVGGEIVNADSQQVYRGLDIGTGKPTEAERAAVPHHLYDVADPWEQLDAARYIALADEAIADVASRGALPIVVGGTGLWIRSLLKGLVDAPPRDPELRETLERELAEGGPAALHTRLSQLDPLAAERIRPSDPVRIVRAMEVRLLSGESIVELHRRHALGAPRYDALRLLLDWPMDALEQRIRQRVRAMFDEGLVAETERAYQDERARDRLSRVMGYREALQVMRGEWSRDEAIEATVRAQRQYAKRQRTWFRGEPEWVRLDQAGAATEAVRLVTQWREQEGEPG